MQDPTTLGDDEDVELEPSTQKNISYFSKMPQEVVTTKKSRAKPLVDYSQSQILTSREHVEALHKIAQKKEELAQGRKAKKVERELTKHARAAEKQKAREERSKGLMRANQEWLQIHMRK